VGAELKITTILLAIMPQLQRFLRHELRGRRWGGGEMGVKYRKRKRVCYESALGENSKEGTDRLHPQFSERGIEMKGGVLRTGVGKQRKSVDVAEDKKKRGVTEQ